MTTRSLPSWTNGEVKTTILDFVRRVTDIRDADYVPPAERIAVFDNDGTLWCEQPLQVQVFFLIDRVKALAAADPSITERQPFKAFLKRDMKTLHELGKRGIQELFFATHSGMTEDEFRVIARDWLAAAVHPKLKRPFTALTYQPQVELLELLREDGFKVFIVSGGGVDLIRAFAEHAYGVPPEQVIGSSARLHAEDQDGRVALRKLPELETFDDREAKVENIGLHIGRRPILAFGNSDGDLAMLRYAKSAPGSRLALLLHHDDGAREFAYDREFKLSPLSEALDKADAFGLTVVSMKRDWNVVFSADAARAKRAPVGEPAH